MNGPTRPVWTLEVPLIAAAVVWGWTFVLVKQGASDVGTFTFLFYRFALAELVLLALFRRNLRGVPIHIWLKGLLIGAVLFSGYWLQTWGLLYTSAIKSGFITGLSVVLVPLLGALLFRHRAERSAWIGALLSSLGLALILFGTYQRVQGFNVGDLLTLLCALAFALQIQFVSRFTRPKRYQALLVAQIGAVMALSAIGFLAVEGPSLPQQAATWQGIAITGLLATALAYWIQNRFQPHSTAARTAIIFSSEPMFAALFGHWLLGETLLGIQWAGAGAILVAMVLSQWGGLRSRRRSRPAGEPQQTDDRSGQ